MPLFPKHVVILHGYAETPRKVWIPWLKKKLEAEGVHVDVPDMPDPLRPDFREWSRATRTALRHAGPNTLIIGHSLGGVIALRVLERMEGKKVGGVLLVGAPYCSTIKVELFIRFFSGEIDWKTVNSRVGRVTVLHAEDDPLVPYDHAYRYAEQLGAKLALRKKGGHFTSKTSTVIWKAVQGMMKGKGA